MFEGVDLYDWPLSFSLNNYICTNCLDFVSRLSCVGGCVCVWFLQESRQLEDSPVVVNWEGDAVLPSPTVISGVWGWWEGGGGFCSGQVLLLLCHILDSHSLSSFL